MKKSSFTAKENLILKNLIFLQKKKSLVIDFLNYTYSYYDKRQMTNVELKLNLYLILHRRHVGVRAAEGSNHVT